MLKKDLSAFPEDTRLVGEGRFVSYVSMFPESGRGPQSEIVIRPFESIRVDVSIRPSDDACVQLAALRGSIRDIAHDLNGVLQVLFTNTAFLEEQRHNDAEKSDLFCQIQTGLAQLKDLSAILACLSKGEPDALGGITDVSEQLETAVKGYVSSSDVEIRTELEFPAQIRMNPSTFVRIVQNLVLNAVQAMEHRGCLKIRAGIVMDNQDLHFVEIKIADSGCGIAPDDLPRIFDRCFSTKGTGRGNGLAIVKSLVESHQGSISVDSTPGNGTTFTLRFPALRPYGDEP